MAVSEEELAYGEMVKSNLLEKNSEIAGEDVPFYKAWPSRLARGAIEGMLDFSALGYIPDIGEPKEQYAEQREKLRELYQPALPVTPEERAGHVEKGIQRAGKLLLPVALGGGTVLQTLMGAAAGGVGGQVAEEAGFGPLGQTVGEIVGSMGPGVAEWAMKPRFNPVGAEQEALTEFGRAAGLTEQDIALSSGQRGVARDVAEKLSAKGGETVRAFERTRENLGRVWRSLRDRPDAKLAMKEVDSSKMINNMSNKLSKMSSEARNKLQTDFNDFLGTQMTGEDVIDLWQKINYHVSKGERVLGTLKPDLLEGIATLSPELAADFSITNQLYGNFAKQAERMGPDIADKLVTVGEAGIVLNGILTGNVGALQKVLGAVVGRNLARNMVIDPKMQNIGSRLISSINKGSTQGVIKTYNQLVNEVAKNNAEAARILSQFDIDEYAKELIELKDEED